MPRMYLVDSPYLADRRVHFVSSPYLADLQVEIVSSPYLADFKGYAVESPYLADVRVCVVSGHGGYAGGGSSGSPRRTTRSSSMAVFSRLISLAGIGLLLVTFTANEATGSQGPELGWENLGHLYPGNAPWYAVMGIIGLGLFCFGMSSADAERKMRPAVTEEMTERGRAKLSEAKHLEDGDGSPSWVPLIREAARAGNAEAARLLGDAYRDRKGVARSRRRALAWYRESALLGDAEAGPTREALETGWDRTWARTFAWSVLEGQDLPLVNRIAYSLAMGVTMLFMGWWALAAGWLLALFVGAGFGAAGGGYLVGWSVTAAVFALGLFLGWNDRS